MTNLQCKDLSEDKIIDWLKVNGPACSFEGFDNYIGNAFIPPVPHKLLMAKLRNMISKGKIDGCACGCRGDFGVIRL